MKRLIPLLITIIGGFVLIISFFIPAWQESGEVVAAWFDTLASIAFILGGGNLLAVHLKKISDRTAGWGYSAITLVAFLTTLWIGLLKVGAPPAPETEFYGETFAPIPLAALPVFTTPGSLPARDDGTPLPASVRTTNPPQFSANEGELTFRGWMTAQQRAELLDYSDTLEWQAAVETLAEKAEPPQDLRGKISYHPEYGLLGVQGVLSPADRQALSAVFGDQPQAASAVERLWNESRRTTTLNDARPPAGFEIPADDAEIVQLKENVLTVRGPISLALRDQLAIDWLHPDRVRPLPAGDRDERMRSLETLGAPWTDAQRKAIEARFAAIWTPEALIAALDSAGLAPTERKSARELLAEKQAGETNLVATKPPGENVALNATQQQAVQGYASDPSMSAAELLAALQAAGPLLPSQGAALGTFLEGQPTVAEFDRQLAMDLLKLHRGNPVIPRPSPAQLDRLLATTRERAAWRRQVDDLFRRAHQPKFAWSGNYSGPGTPFDWIYSYLFQPITATMFAMLAFYVASAAFRAFRAKNVEAILLLGTAFIILLMQTPLGAMLTEWLPDELAALRADNLKRYITVIFATAGGRAIMIGIALGVVATSLKILLGVDQSYLGSGDE